VAKRKFVDLEVEEVSLVAAGANKHDKKNGAYVRMIKADGRINVVEKASGATCRICATGVADSDKYCRGCGAPFYKTEEKNMTDQEKAAQAAEAEKAASDKAAAEKAEADKVAAEKAATEKAAADKAQADAADAEKAAEAKKAAEQTDLQKAQTELQKSQAKVAELEKAAKIRTKKDHVASVMKAIPGKQDELAEKLVALDILDGDIAKFVEGVLTQASALIEKGGLAQNADPTVPTVDAGVLAKVDKLVAKKLEGVSKPSKAQKAKAEAAVWQENPDLYAEYLKSQAQA